MSENRLILVPSDERFVPSEEAITLARKSLKSWFPSTVELEIKIHDSIVFYDSGTNLEAIYCPNCSKKLDLKWWQEAMNRSYKTNFEDLFIVTPCCQRYLSLNTLNYEWTCGFAKFALIVRNPSIEINNEQLKHLSDILTCQIRRIWQRR